MLVGNAKLCIVGNSFVFLFLFPHYTGFPLFHCFSDTSQQNQRLTLFRHCYALLHPLIQRRNEPKRRFTCGELRRRFGAFSAMSWN